MTDPLHLDRRRAEIFGEAAAAYETARPSYPAPLIDWLLAERPDRALDIGCGTGKLGRLLVDRGVNVTGVEPDENMGSFAATHGILVERGRFEDWDRKGRRFPLIVAGQSWHWVDPARGATKLVETLEPAGRFVAVWNRDEFADDELRAELDDAYRAHAPALVEHDPESEDRYLETLDEAFAATGRLERPVMHTDHWLEELSGAAYLEWISTYSDHRLLAEPARTALLDEVGASIKRHGGAVLLEQRTVAFETRPTAPGSSLR
jgi:SAM-dependent methyltransferase